MLTSLLLPTLLATSGTPGANTPSPIPPGQAEVILEAHSPWGQRGYQMALDADHTAYEELELGGTYYKAGNYLQFEYLIPENADCDPYSSNAVIDGEQAITIPAGTYDFMVVATHGDKPAAGFMDFVQGGQHDDFVFVEGGTYRFRVNDMDEVELIVANDLAVDKVILPPNSPFLTGAEPVSVVVANRGTEPVYSFKISYAVNGGSPETETVTHTIPPGESVICSFSTKADFSQPGRYTVSVGVTLDGDLVATNDRAVATCVCQSVEDLPFRYDFSTRGKEAFSLDWKVIDNDNDQMGWAYDDYEPGIDGVLGCAYNSGTDDTMVSLPVRLSAGTHNISFQARYLGFGQGKDIVVAYGTDLAAPEGFETISSQVVSREEYMVYASNFTVSSDGVYFFSFRSEAPMWGMVLIDDIAIEKGEARFSPRPVIGNVILPYSNCALSDQTAIGIVVSNNGPGATSALDISYSINSASPVVEHHPIVIAPYDKATIYFDTRADLSAPGSYSVTASVKCDGQEASSATETVENTLPITRFPAETIFTEAEYTDMWHELTPGTWNYEPFFHDLSTRREGRENGLISRCLTFDGPMRFKIAYMESEFDPCVFNVAVGKAGDDLGDFVTVYTDEMPRQGREVEIDIPVDEPGEYNILLYLTGGFDTYHSFRLYHSILSAVLPDDIRISMGDCSFSRRTPESQLAGNAVYYADIENRGTAIATNVSLALHNGESILATSDNIPSILPGQCARATIRHSFNGPGASDVISGLTLVAKSDSEDMAPDDNVWNVKTVEISDDEFATETLYGFENGVGGDTRMSFGNIYTLGVADNLCGISVGFAYTEDEFVTGETVRLAVYRMEEDGETVGHEIYSTEFVRGAGGDLREFDFEPMKLLPGSYFFEVTQYDYVNIGLACESPSEESSYLNTDGKLLRNQGGALAIRARFDSSATPHARDVAVTSLLSPSRLSKIFDDDETIAVRIDNKGYEHADVTVSCTVDGHAASTPVTLDMPPYAHATAELTGIDLSTPGDHIVKITAVTDGDEDGTNDKMSLTLNCQQTQSPYTMDFEECGDFDISSDKFNPRWKSVTFNSGMTDAFTRYEYPHKNEAVGFIAFSPSLTRPSMDEDLKGQPHSGRRFGASFTPGWGSDPDQADTWLISPKLTLCDDSSIELYVKSYEIPYAGSLERYQLLVSQTDDDPSSFTILGDEQRTAPEEWTRVEESLAAYDGKEVHVAVRHIGKLGENFLFMVDDIKVKTQGAGVESVKAEESSIYLRYDPATQTLAATAPTPLHSVTVTDMAGHVVASIAPSKPTATVTMANLQGGVYVATAVTANTTRSLKFIVSKVL